MAHWKETLRIEHEALVGEATLSLLQADGPVALDFGGSTALTPAMEAAVDALLARLPSMENNIAEVAFTSYQAIWAEFHDEDVFPEATDAKALKPFYQLQHIYLPEEPEVGRFGLGFECEWEIEHGFGLQFRNWQIVEIGGEAEAFSFYD